MGTNLAQNPSNSHYSATPVPIPSATQASREFLLAGYSDSDVNESADLGNVKRVGRLSRLLEVILDLDLGLFLRVDTWMILTDILI